MLAEHRCPGGHRRRRHLPCSPCLGFGSSPFLRRPSDNELLKVVVRTHRVQDGLHRAFAEGARGPALSPLPDAAKTKLVQARHHVASVIHSVQANGAEMVQLGGHAVQLLWWAGERRG